MAIFLNTTKLNEWIPRLIREAKREIVIIVPYIKTSQNTYNELLNADKRGIETTIVYREDKLTEIERKKFDVLSNLNLMYHPNVHAKCYYNGDLLIITSMNMYEYSELNNREMGILIHKEDFDNTFGSSGDDDTIFNEAIDEIREILNGSTLFKSSKETLEEGFEVDIIKTDKERTEEYCKILNKIFVHKKFEPHLMKNDWVPMCRNYFDKINIAITNRVEMYFEFPEDKVKKAFESKDWQNMEFFFKGYKLYWNWYKSPMYLYKNTKFAFWDTDNKGQRLSMVKDGINEVIEYLRKNCF